MGDAGDGERNSFPRIVAQGILRAVTQKERIQRNAKTQAFEERNRKAWAKAGAPWSPLEPNYQSTSESFPQNVPPPSAGPCSSFGSRFACGFGGQGAARRSTPTQAPLHLPKFEPHPLAGERHTFVVELESSISTSYFSPAIPATSQARHPPVNRPTRNTPTIVITPPGESQHPFCFMTFSLVLPDSYYSRSQKSSDI